MRPFKLLLINFVDIDECVLGTHGCNSTVSFCDNTNGSFRCICREGFNMSADGVCVCKLALHC